MKFQYYNFGEFQKFLNSLSTTDAAKLISKIHQVEQHGLLVSLKSQQVKQLEHNLFEIRAHLSHSISRSLYFKAENHRYVISHTFIKKSQKTPNSEIAKAKYRRRKFNDSNR